MDPLSQAVLGAAFSTSFARKAEIRIAATVGAVSGMAADLDVLIQSKKDPLLFLEYHRHFTHSLFFVPLGALFCSLVFWIFLKKKISFSRLYLFSFLAYLTHGLLDACTSYGTQLLWPFSNARVAWNNIGIVDPLYTLPLFIFVLMAAFLKKVSWARVGMILSCAYLIFGVYQQNRAETFAIELIKSRGQTIQRLEVKPTILNLFLWRLIYESKGNYYVDALRVGPFMESKVYPGSSVQKYDWKSEIEKLPQSSTLAKDIERFAWFSDNYLYQAPEHPDLISDLRYSMLPQQTLALWGIQLNPQKPDQHVEFVSFRRPRKGSFSSLIKMILGKNL